MNPSAQQSLQYGYLNFVRGLGRITTSASAAVSEFTALLHCGQNWDGSHLFRFTRRQFRGSWHVPERHTHPGAIDFTIK
jgi:hypothetical protein